MFTFEYYNGQMTIFTATGNAVRDVLLGYQEGRLHEQYIKYVYRYSKTLQVAIMNGKYKFTPGEMYQLQLDFTNGMPCVKSYFNARERMSYFYKNKIKNPLEKSTWTKFFGASSMPYYHDSDEEESDSDYPYPEYESDYVETDYGYHSDDSPESSEWETEQPAAQELESEFSDEEFSD